ncbi:MAG: hypothetical protein AB1566_06280 [Chloroflexota bacterium]
MSHLLKIQLMNMPSKESSRLRTLSGTQEIAWFLEHHAPVVAHHISPITHLTSG